MRTAIAGLALLLVVATSWALAEGQQNSQAVTNIEKPREFDFWMTAKLKESQKIFAALTEADFQTIVESASTLKTLNKVEGFVRKRDPAYRTQLRSFEFAVNEIQRQANKENIEGVVLGFNQLTLSCVHCHKQLRDREDVSP